MSRVESLKLICPKSGKPTGEVFFDLESLAAGKVVRSTCPWIDISEGTKVFQESHESEGVVISPMVIIGGSKSGDRITIEGKLNPANGDFEVNINCGHCVNQWTQSYEK